ncbi:MAG TPA: VCBS repeat-containing protein [Planctomycetota bacterium]
MPSLSRLVAAALLLSLPARAQVGPWAQHSIDSNPSSSLHMALGDLDGDGDADLLNGAAWYENRPAGFQRRFLTSSSHGRELHDLDRDGDLDVAGTDGPNSAVYWLENDGGAPPTFAQHVIATSLLHLHNGAGARVGDLDSDGDPDLVAGEVVRGYLWWHENLAGDLSSWVARPIWDGPVLNGFELADLDGDGDPDVLASATTFQRPGQGYTWYENRPGLAWGRHPLGGRGNEEERQARPVDLDGDGDTDVAFTTTSFDGTSAVGWFERRGPRPQFQAHVLATTIAPNRFGRFAVADLDGDGAQDLARTSGRGIGWSRNLGGGASWADHAILLDTLHNTPAVEAADLDGDGDLDLAARLDRLTGGSSVRSLAWFENPR